MVQLLTPILVPLKFLFWSFLCFGLAGFLTGLQSGNATYQMSLTRPASGGGREKTHTNCIWQHPVSVCEERIGNQNSTDEWWTVWKVGGGRLMESLWVVQNSVAELFGRFGHVRVLEAVWKKVLWLCWIKTKINNEWKCTYNFTFLLNITLKHYINLY